MRIRVFSKKKAQLAFLPFIYKKRTDSHKRYIFFEGLLKEAESIVLGLGFEGWARQRIQCFKYLVDYKNKRLEILDESLGNN